MIHDLYLRAHIVVSGNTGKAEKSSARRSRPPKPWPDCALVWDTETTLDLEQTLNFGVWRFCQLQDTEYVTVQEGIFHSDGLATTDVETILAYKKTHLAEAIAGGVDPHLVVLSRAAFIERIFWESVRAGALIVGFNLSFDISRIAVDWTPAHNGGFSFVLSQLSRNKLNNVHRPRIRIAPLNGAAERIELTAVRWEKEQHRWRRFRPLDLHTLAFALTDESYSLAGAIKAFGSSPQKMEDGPTGRVNDEEITYARRDVLATLGLLNALKHEYGLHPIDLLPDRAYSPVSLFPVLIYSKCHLTRKSESCDLPGVVGARVEILGSWGTALCLSASNDYASTTRLANRIFTSYSDDFYLRANFGATSARTNSRAYL